MSNEPRVKRSLPLLNAAGERLAFGGSFEETPRYEPWDGYAAAMELREAMERKARETMQQSIPDEYLNTIITGDAKELAKRIPDNSIDLVFSDPIYDRIEDYAWLAETAARVLKPNRACLAWCSNVKQYEVQPAMREYLRFVLPLNYTKIAKTYAAHRYRAFLWSTPLLWFQKGDFVHNWLIDTVVDVMQGNSIVTALAPPSDTYKWHKNPEAFISWLKAFTKPGDVVWDPFAGSGSLPVECKRMGRTFIASELKPDIAALARERIAQTPVGHPVLWETQDTMELA